MDNGNERAGKDHKLGSFKLWLLTAPLDSEFPREDLLGCNHGEAVKGSLPLDARNHGSVVKGRVLDRSPQRIYVLIFMPQLFHPFERSLIHESHLLINIRVLSMSGVHNNPHDLRNQKRARWDEFASELEQAVNSAMRKHTKPFSVLGK